MKPGGGHLLLTGALLLILLFQIGRVFFFVGEGPVAFVRKPEHRVIELGSGFSMPQIHQIFDGSTWRDVIKLTHVPIGSECNKSPQLDGSVHDGERIDLVVKNDIIKGLSVSWMSAAKRVSLGIPLHPDRMDLQDWQFLPGVGERMARKIILNRQKNGDFGAFSALRRVPGIGERHLTSWNQYFFTDESQAK